MLVGPEGKIVFVGHPSSRQLEKDIDTLLKGEKLTGKGTSNEGGADGEEGEDASFKDLDLTTVTAEMSRWEDEIKRLAST